VEMIRKPIKELAHALDTILNTVPKKRIGPRVT
jgi:hypothetical protein